MPDPYMTTMPMPGQTPMPVTPLPAPGYDELLARARLKMLDMPGSPGIPQPPARTGPMNWADTGLMGAGSSAGDDSLKDLPPGLRRAFDRLPPDMRDRLLGMWENRGAGFVSQRGEGGGGGRDTTGEQWGQQGDGSMGSGTDDSSSSGIPGFGSGPLGKGWSRGASLVGGMINPFAGLAMEGGRRANNMSYANSQRDMLGISRPGAFGDFFGAGGSGSPTRSIGKVDIGGRSTGVSYGGMLDSGRTSYTPEEARRRQAAQNYGGYRGGGGYGGGDGGRSTAGVGGGGFGSEADRTSSPGGMGGY